MIDFENYERVTVKNIGNYTQIKDNVSTLDCLKRLAELEDLIEKGKLVPKYYIEKSGDWFSVNEYNSDYHDCLYETTEETKAKAKLKQLMEGD